MVYGSYPEKKDVKNILVIKLRQLGDVLLTTPVFENLKKHFENANVYAYVYKDAEEILDENPYIDGIITLDRKFFKKLNFFKKFLFEIFFLRKIVKNKFDLVINLTEGDRGAIVAKLSRAKYKVGFFSEKKGLFKKDKFYSHLVKTADNRHTVEKNLDSIRRIGIFPKINERVLLFNISKKTEDKILKNLETFKNFVLIHPTSRWMFKALSICQMKKNIQKLLDQKKKIVITSSSDKNEIKFIEELLKDFKSSDILNLSGKTTISELAAIVKLSSFVICMDSLVLHLTSCFKKKCYVFFGPSSQINWGPWQNENAKIISKNLSCQPCNLDGCGKSKFSDCLEQIDVDDLDFLNT